MKISFTDIIIFHTFRKHLMEVGLDKGSGWFFPFLSKAQHYLRLEFSVKLACVLYSLCSEKVSKLFHPKIKVPAFCSGPPWNVYVALMMIVCLRSMVFLSLGEDIHIHICSTTLLQM